MRMPKFHEMTPDTGAYVTFYCESCGSPISSSPDVGGALATQVKNALMRNIPVVGWYLRTQQTVDREAHWRQVQEQFGECTSCKKVVCRGCWDAQQGKCTKCRIDQKAAEVADKVGQAATGMAAAIGQGLGALGTLGNVAALAFVDCPACGQKTPRAKACQHCGKPLPESAYKQAWCPKCNTKLMPGAKFCPACSSAAVYK